MQWAWLGHLALQVTGVVSQVRIVTIFPGNGFDGYINEIVSLGKTGRKTERKREKERERKREGERERKKKERKSTVISYETQLIHVHVVPFCKNSVHDPCLLTSANPRLLILAL